MWPTRYSLLGFERILFLETLILVLEVFLCQNHCATEKCANGKLPQVKWTAFKALSLGLQSLDPKDCVFFKSTTYKSVFSILDLKSKERSVLTLF